MLILASASPRRRELLTQAGFTFQVHPTHIPEDPRPNEDPIAYVVRLAREKAETVFREIKSAPIVADAVTQVADAVTQVADAVTQVADAVTQVADAVTQVADAVTQVADELLPVKGTGFSPYIQSAKEAWALAPEGTLSETLTDTRLVVLGADTTVTLDNQILGKPEDPADAARMLRLLSGRTHRVITGVAVVTAQRTEVAAEVTGVTFRTLSDEEIAAYVATGEPMDKAGAYAIQGRAARFIPRIQGDYFNVVGLPIALVSTLLESR
jgi:septum formation protein